MAPPTWLRGRVTERTVTDPAKMIGWHARSIDRLSAQEQSARHVIAAVAHSRACSAIANAMRAALEKGARR